MTNRSYISLVGNSTTGQNLGTGVNLFKGKNNGNNLQFNTISGSGATIVSAIGDDIFVYTPTGGTSSITLIGSGDTVVTQSGDTWIIYNSGSTGGGTITGSTNGLSVSGADIALGGTLTGNTIIVLDDKSLRLSSSYTQLNSGFMGISGPNSGNVLAFGQQSDGKLVLVGDMAYYNNVSIGINMARLDVNGTLDTGFISGGFDNQMVSNAFAIQNDNKLIIGGYFTTYSGVSSSRIIRLDSGGTIDNTFVVGSGFDSRVDAIALHSGGTVMVSGNFTTYSGASSIHMIRLNADGSHDSSFVVTGNGLDSYNNPFSVYGLIIQPDNKILVGGSFDAYNGTPWTPNIPTGLIRFNWDGSVDSTFSGITTGFAGGAGIVFDLALQPNGKILAVGDFSTYNGITYNQIIRLNSDGSVDTGFTIGTGFNNTGYPMTISLQADGKILLGGFFSEYNGTTVTNIVRLNSDGSIDNTFVGVTNNGVQALLELADGNIMVGGNFTTYNGTSIGRNLRVYSGGTIDTTYNFSTVYDYITFSGDTITTPNLIASGFTLASGNQGTNKIMMSNSNGCGDWCTSPFICGYSKSADGTTAAGFSVRSCSASICRGTFFGVQAGCGTQPSGCNNVAVGFQALCAYPNSGINNVAVGTLALSENLTGNNNVAVGSQALNKNTSGGANIGIGTQTLCCNTTGSGNTAMGYHALCKNISGGGNIAIGTQTLCSNTTGGNNIAMGYQALCKNLSNGNIGLGYLAASNNTNGVDNIAIGCCALKGNILGITGSYNIGLGGCALFSNRNGCGNIAVGLLALENNFSGQDNVAIGIQSLRGNNSGCQNVAVGSGTLSSNNFSYNVGVGFQALYNNQGCENVAVGRHALCGNINGCGNVAVGNCAGFYELGSDKLYISNTYTPRPLICGDFLNKTLTVNGSELNINNEICNFITGSGFDGTVDVVVNDTYDNYLVGGSFFTYNGASVSRFVKISSTGVLDTAFVLSGGTGFDSAVNSIAVNTNDDTIFVGGFFNSFNGFPTQYIAKINPNGTLDTGFTTNLGFGFDNSVNAIAVNTNEDTVIIGGQFTAYSGGSLGYIAKLSSAGVLDTGFTFNSGLGFDFSVTSIAINLNDDSILVGGYFTTYSGVTYNGIIRLNSNGTIDPTFSGVTTGFSGLVETIALNTSDDTIMAGGYFTGYNSSTAPYIARLTPSGAYDSTFSGITLGSLDSGINSLIIDTTDSSVIVGGTFTQYGGLPFAFLSPYIARYLGDGNIDTGFTVNNGYGFNTVVTSLAWGVSSKVVVVGQFTTFNTHTTNRIAQLYPSGLFDSTLIDAKISFNTHNNTIYGVCAGVAMTATAENNTAIGYSALNGNISGCLNTAIGDNALKKNTVGNYNVGVGSSTLGNLTGGTFNIAIGSYAMGGGQCSSSNIAIGKNALDFACCGQHNIGIGECTLRGTTDGITIKNIGCHNIAIGCKAAQANYCGNNNIAIGVQALCKNTDGGSNIAIGPYSQFNNLSGTGNTTIGRCAGYNETSSDRLYIANCADCSLIYGEFDTKMVIIDGSLCVTKLPAKSSETNIVYIDANGKLSSGATSSASGIGWSNLSNGSTVAGCGTPASASTICQNTYYGVSAGTHTTTARDNVAIGFNALHNNLTTSGNTAIGTNALCSNTGGTNNVAIGYQTLSNNTTGCMNVGIGCNALGANTSGKYNVAIGGDVLACATTPNSNIGIGYLALSNMRTAGCNIAIGCQALHTACGGTNNIGIGTYTLAEITLGTDNIAMGSLALNSLCNGSFNVGLGNGSMASIRGGNYNIGIGPSTLNQLTSGSDNIALGQCSMILNTTGGNNIALGACSLYRNCAGTHNIAFGCEALYCNCNGTNNIGIGQQALRNNTNTQNTAIGGFALTNNTTGSGNTAIGYCAGNFETSSNRLHIANAACTGSTSFIYGEFDSKRLKTNATLEVVSPVSSGVCNEFYLGDKNTDGSWRIVVSGSSLVAQTRAATVWGGNKVIAP